MDSGDEDMFDEESGTGQPDDIAHEVNAALAGAALYEDGDVVEPAAGPSRKREYTNREILDLIRGNDGNCTKTAEDLINALLKYPEDHPKGPTKEDMVKLARQLAESIRRLWSKDKKRKLRGKEGETFITTEHDPMFATQPSQEMSQRNDPTVDPSDLLIEVDNLDIDDPPPKKKKKTPESKEPGRTTRKHFTELEVKQRRIILNELKTTPGLGIFEQFALWAHELDI